LQVDDKAEVIRIAASSGPRFSSAPDGFTRHGLNLIFEHVQNVFSANKMPFSKTEKYTKFHSHKVCYRRRFYPTIERRSAYS
jgi:hypothetical protein